MRNLLFITFLMAIGLSSYPQTFPFKLQDRYDQNSHTNVSRTYAADHRAGRAGTKC
jgi:hypothetical protein